MYRGNDVEQRFHSVCIGHPVECLEGQGKGEKVFEDNHACECFDREVPYCEVGELEAKHGWINRIKTKNTNRTRHSR